MRSFLAPDQGAEPVLGVKGQAVAITVLTAILLFHIGAYFNFSEDDPGISLRYAADLAEGQGLVYNSGERVEGYSNFGHVILLASLYRFVAGGDRLSLVLIVKIFNVLMAVACAVILSQKIQ